MINTIHDLLSLMMQVSLHCLMGLHTQIRHKIKHHALNSGARGREQMWIQFCHASAPAKKLYCASSDNEEAV